MIYSVDYLKERLGITSKFSPLTLRYESLLEKSSYKSFLITGATGWFARHLLKDLIINIQKEIEANSNKYQLSNNFKIKDFKIKIILPIRAKSLNDAKKRLEISWKKHIILLELLNNNLDYFSLIILPIEDLSTPLPSLDFDVDCLINSAANMSLALDLDGAWCSNVLSVQNLWNWAVEHKVKRFDHISTLSVFVASNMTDGVLYESSSLDDVKNLYGGYASSKWCAERFLIDKYQNNSNTPRLSIHRLGLICHSSSEGLAPNDSLYFVRLAIEKYGVPDKLLDISKNKEIYTQYKSLKMDFTPVDYASLGVVKSIVQGISGVFHWAGKKRISFFELNDALIQNYKMKNIVNINNTNTANNNKNNDIKNKSNNNEISWPLNERVGKNATRAMMPILNEDKAKNLWWHHLFQSSSHSYDLKNSSLLVKSLDLSENLKEYLK